MSLDDPEAGLDPQAIRAWQNGVVLEPVLYRHIPVPLRKLMETVAEVRGLSMAAIRGRRQTHLLVNARVAIAVLALEFLHNMTIRAIEDGMLRGSGYVDWCRLRHADRLALYEKYAVLFQECHAAVEARRFEFR